MTQQDPGTPVRLEARQCGTTLRLCLAPCLAWLPSPVGEVFAAESTFIWLQLPAPRLDCGMRLGRGTFSASFVLLALLPSAKPAMV